MSNIRSNTSEQISLLSCLFFIFSSNLIFLNTLLFSVSSWSLCFTSSSYPSASLRLISSLWASSFEEYCDDFSYLTWTCTSLHLEYLQIL